MFVFYYNHVFELGLPSVLMRRGFVTDCVIIVSVWVSSLPNCKMKKFVISSGLMSPADLNKLLLELLK